MKLTLNKAGKCTKQLLKELNTLKYKIEANAYTQIKYNKITDTNREKTNLLVEQDEFENSLKNYHLIEFDIYNLKKTIDDKNNEVGINVILKNIDRTRELLDLYTELSVYTESQFLYPDEAVDIMKVDIDKMKNSEEIKDKVVSVSKFKNKLMMSEAVKLYKKQISMLEDEKFEKNNSKNINIELSIVSKELLGLTE